MACGDLAKALPARTRQLGLAASELPGKVWRRFLISFGIATGGSIPTPLSAHPVKVLAVLPCSTPHVFHVEWMMTLATFEMGFLLAFAGAAMFILAPAARVRRLGLLQACAGLMLLTGVVLAILDEPPRRGATGDPPRAARPAAPIK